MYGVELGQPHHNPEEARALLQRHPYDMVIGSVHTLADGRDIYYTPYPDKDACREVLDIYFEDLENLLKFGDFDTLGHLDYPLRVMEGPWEEPTLAEYKEPVSYTHLDVYKRQSWCPAGEPGCCQPAHTDRRRA